MDVTRLGKVRPPKKSRKIVMRLSSVNDLKRREVNGYLLLERPAELSWSSNSLGKLSKSRPSLKKDLTGPTPWSYSAQLPAPSVHGTKINPRSKYARDALPNHNTDIWTYNISLLPQTPGPTKYGSPNVLGQHCPVTRQAPAFSLTPRRQNGVGVVIPAPNVYDSAKAREITLAHFPAFSMAAKNASRSMPTTPGPAHYHPVHTVTKHHSPAFSMQQRRNNNMRTF